MRSQVFYKLIAVQGDGFFLMVAGSSQGKLFLTQHGGHSPANFNLFRFIQFSLRLFNKKLYTIYIRIKPA